MGGFQSYTVYNFVLGDDGYHLKVGYYWGYDIVYPLLIPKINYPYTIFC